MDVNKTINDILTQCIYFYLANTTNKHNYVDTAQIENKLLRKIGLFIKECSELGVDVVKNTRILHEMEGQNELA